MLRVPIHGDTISLQLFQRECSPQAPIECRRQNARCELGETQRVIDRHPMESLPRRDLCRVSDDACVQQVLPVEAAPERAQQGGIVVR